jgi:hypothetical protein
MSGTIQTAIRANGTLARKESKSKYDIRTATVLGQKYCPPKNERSQFRGDAALL